MFIARTLQAMPKAPRDAVLARLKEITDLACRGWMESLPVVVDHIPATDAEVERLCNVRRQRLAIHKFQSEAAELAGKVKK